MTHDSLAPVAPDERIHALDLLRGWAMFGVLWSNLNDGYGTRDPVTALDRGLAWTQTWLIESRFYTLLILLFGIGFGIQLLRATDRGVDVRNAYYRRSAALLAIGVVHGCLIWSGDILTIYSLVAFALVMFRNASNRRLVVTAIVLLFVGRWLVRDLMFLGGLRFMIPTGPQDSVLAHGTWLQIEPVRVAGYLQWLGRWGLPSYVSILAAFLIGLWAIKSGYLRRVFEEPRVTRRLLFVAIVAAALGYARWAWADAIWQPFQAPPGFEPRFPYPYFQLSMFRQAVLGLFDWATEGTSIAYACLLLLAWQTPTGARLLRPLTATGRMALTTYLTQSVVCTLLFYGYGLGWYGQVGFTGMFLVTLVLYGLQMAASTWWLRRHAFGPAEWLWRTLTYGRAPASFLATRAA